MDKFILNENRRSILLEEVSYFDGLKVLKKTGLDARYTDFALALGAKYVPGELGLETIYNLKCSNTPNTRAYVSGSNIIVTSNNDELNSGLRLVTNMPEEFWSKVFKNAFGDPVIFYGGYPQSIAHEAEREMEKVKNPKSVHRYAVPVHEDGKCTMGYAPEYLLDGREYVRLDITNLEDGGVTFSDGSKAFNGESKFFRIEPIKWYVDAKTGLLISEDILSYGIPVSYMNAHEDNVKRLTKKHKIKN